MIHETIITTRNADGSTHIVPMGVRREDDVYVIAPFKPSSTLQNLRERGEAVVNFTDDVRIFAGCLTGRHEWPLKDAVEVGGAVLEAALAHVELRVSRIEEDEVRPGFYCEVLHEQIHAPFRGFNRAQAAVVEAAILVSRLHMLPAEKVEREIAYLAIAVDKTAGERERTAWNWLLERIEHYRDEAGSEAASR